VSSLGWGSSGDWGGSWGSSLFGVASLGSWLLGVGLLDGLGVLLGSSVFSSFDGNSCYRYRWLVYVDVRV